MQRTHRKAARRCAGLTGVIFGLAVAGSAAAERLPVAGTDQPVKIGSQQLLNGAPVGFLRGVQEKVLYGKFLAANAKYNRGWTLSDADKRQVKKAIRAITRMGNCSVGFEPSIGHTVAHFFMRGEQGGRSIRIGILGDVTYAKGGESTTISKGERYSPAYGPEDRVVSRYFDSASTASGAIQRVNAALARVQAERKGGPVQILDGDKVWLSAGFAAGAQAPRVTRQHVTMTGKALPGADSPRPGDRIRAPERFSSGWIELK